MEPLFKADPSLAISYRVHELDEGCATMRNLVRRNTSSG